jgi:Ni/Co efflux regulator RcnB
MRYPCRATSILLFTHARSPYPKEPEMNKFISTVVIAAFTAVCSFSAVAGDVMDKNKDNLRKDTSDMDKKGKKGDKYENKSDSASDEAVREKSLSERKEEYRDQESMNKKPYKQ